MEDCSITIFELGANIIVDFSLKNYNIVYLKYSEVVLVVSILLSLNSSKNTKLFL